MEVELEINSKLPPSEAIEAISNEFKESGALSVESFKRISDYEIRAIRIYGANTKSDPRDRRGEQSETPKGQEALDNARHSPSAGSNPVLPPSSHTPRVSNQGQPERLSPVQRITTPNGAIDLDNYYLQTWSMKGKKIKEVSLKELEDNKSRLLPIDLKAYEQYLLSLPKPAIQSAFNLAANQVRFEDDTIPY